MNKEVGFTVSEVHRFSAEQFLKVVNNPDKFKKTEDKVRTNGFVVVVRHAA